MIARALVLLAGSALAAAPALAADKHSPATQTGTQSRFEQFKLLAGEWLGKEQGKDGHDVHVRYQVTAGGSAVVETLFPGTEHEMVTVIHPDGDGLLLTHYCMLGNQPQMRAEGKGDPNKVAFKFMRATNLKSENDMYMHDATFTFVDKDTVRAQWTLYKDGRSAHQSLFEYKRKK